MAECAAFSAGYEAGEAGGRADLTAPSAPAEVEGLDYEAIDAIRLEAFRTNDHATKQRFLEAAGRWFQYESCRAMDRATAMTAQQAEIERLRGTVDFWENCAVLSEKRAEKAGAERDAWKANAKELAEAGCAIDVLHGSFGKARLSWHKALAAYAKLKGDV